MKYDNMIDVLKASKLFDDEFYLFNNPDVQNSGFSSYKHYAEHGWKEGRDPSREFSTNGYMLINKDVLELNINPLYYHETIGKVNGRKIISVEEFCNDDTYRNLAKKKYKLPHSYYKDDYHKNEDIYLSMCLDPKNLMKTVKTKNNLKVVFFTCISNNYDTLKKAFYKIENATYYAFSDSCTPSIEPWNVFPCLYNHKDPTRTARFIKTHPYLFFENYDIAVWIDSNIIINGDLSTLIDDFYDSGKTIGCIAHPYRRSVYDEFIACKISSRDSHEAMHDFIQKLKFEGFKDEDLFETNVLMYNMRNDNLKEFLVHWWECIDSYSKRDQLSIMYSMNKFHIDFYYFLGKKISTRNSKYFIYSYHDGVKSTTQGSLLFDSIIANPYSGKSYYECRDTFKPIEKDTVDIIICVYNAFEATKKCLDSILQTTSENVNVVLIDDFSTDKRVNPFLKSFIKKKNFKLIENKENLGYVKSINIGLANTKSGFVILLNSDTVVTRGWVEKLHDAAFSSTHIGIVGPLSNSASFQSLPSFGCDDNTNTAINTVPYGITYEDINLECEKWSIVNHYPFWPLVHGFCMGIKRSVIDIIGYFDELKFGKGYGEENEFCLRAWGAGFVGVIATNTFIYHEKSQSFDDEKERIRLMTHGATAFKANVTSHKYTNLISAMSHNKIVEAFRCRASKMFLASTVKEGHLKRFFLIPSLSFCDDKEDMPTGSAYTRLIYPFERLGMTNFNVNIFKSLKAPHKLPSRDEFDVVVIQREGIGVNMNEFISWAIEWKRNGGKIIYDIDDDLELVLEEAKSRIETFVQIANVVIVSTQNLKNKFSLLNSNIFMISNKLDEELWNFDMSFNEVHELKAAKDNSKLHVGYIGTPSHYEEVASLEQQFLQLNFEFKNNLEFDVVGAFQRECPKFANKIPLPKDCSYKNFVNWIFKISRFDVVVLPLAENSFNDSKSNLKFIEYAALALPIVCSSHHVYSEIAQNYVNCIVEENNCFINGVRRLLSDSYLRHSLAITARTQIVEKYGLYSNMKLYSEIVNQL